MKETKLNRTKPCCVNRLFRPPALVRVFFAIALGVVARHEALGGSAYLPCVGPPVLRFEPVAATNAATAAKIFTPEVVKDSKVAAPVAEPLVNATNAAATAAAGLDTANNAAKVSSPMISLTSATDVSVVTPQMLADYLKPTAGATIFVPVKVGFTPPAQVGGESSRAVYKSQ